MLRLRPSVRRTRLLCALGAAAPVILVASAAQAQFAPGDLLAGVEFLTEGGPGRIYRVNAGGDFTDADFEMPLAVPIIDICSTDDGRVLAATSTHRVVYDVTDAVEAKPFATLPLDASGLYCGGGKVFATSLLEGSNLYDISAGGEVTTPYATGVNRAPVVDADGLLWAARLDGVLDGGTGAVFRDVREGDDLTSGVAYFIRPDIFSAALHDGRVFGVAIEGDGVVNMTNGGSASFAHAIVVAPRGIASSGDKLWASTVDGMVFDITQSRDYTNAQPFARVFAPSLSLAVVQRCGDGAIHGRETCDDGNLASGDGCSATCLVEEPPASTTSASSASSTATIAASTNGSGPTATTTTGAGVGGEGGTGGADVDVGGSGCAVGARGVGDASAVAWAALAAILVVARRRR